MAHRGRFLEIDRPKRLVFTWSSEYAGEDSRVTLEFEAQQDRTRLTLTHERLPSKKAIEMHTQGWSAILDKLAAITGLPSPKVRVPYVLALATGVVDELFTGRIRGLDQARADEAAA